LQYYKKIPKEYIPGSVGACEPDGGCYFLYDELVCVFEMKKQILLLMIQILLIL